MRPHARRSESKKPCGGFKPGHPGAEEGTGKVPARPHKPGEPDAPPIPEW